MIRDLRYTKTNGEVSRRKVVVVSNPREHYLVYDVSNFSDSELEVLQSALEKTEEFRNNAMQDFELLTGIKQNSLWRSFKPEGVEWITENDTV